MYLLPERQEGLRQRVSAPVVPSAGNPGKGSTSSKSSSSVWKVVFEGSTLMWSERRGT